MAKFWEWVRKTGDSRDHTAEVIEYAYAGTVILAWVWLSVWLTKGILRDKGPDAGWNQAFMTLAGLVALSKVNNAWAVRDKKPDDLDKQNPAS